MPISVTRRHRLRTLAVRALVAALLSVTSAHAQPAGVGARLDTYEAGSARDQLDVDVTPIPVGMGALMVQSLTDASLEPPVLVYLGDERVARGRTGERIVVPPGEYRVVVGHGPLDRRASTRVRVVEGMTVPTPPFVGAVRITACSRARARARAKVGRRSSARRAATSRSRSGEEAAAASSRSSASSKPLPAAAAATGAGVAWGSVGAGSSLGCGRC